MADISYMLKEDYEDSEEGMEAEGDGEALRGFVGDGDESKGHIFQLARLQQHANSDTTFNRQMVGRILVEIFRSAANTETKLPVEEYMKYVHQICDDPEVPVRSDLVEQLPYVAMICQESPHLFGDVLHDHLLGIIKKYLLDVDNQVRQTAQEALLTLIKRGLLDTKTIQNEFCPIVENLYSMPIEYLNSGISLMSKMALLIGKELTEKVFLERYITLCGDSIFHIRRICAAHFGEICAAVGRKALINKLLPKFVHLCLDSVWGVRKACVDVMMPVAYCASYSYRRIVLADILATHLNDNSKWVRMSAFQILGPFISTFAKQFTNVKYNQDGELGFTSLQEDHFSNDKNNGSTELEGTSDTELEVTSGIQFSYKGISSVKYAMRNETMDSDNYHIRDKLDIDSLRELVRPQLKAYKTKTQKKQEEENEQNDTEDTDKFNTFLYYYIPPELPPDDPLVQAAKNVSRMTIKNTLRSCLKNTDESVQDNQKNDGAEEATNDWDQNERVENSENLENSESTENSDSNKDLKRVVVNWRVFGDESRSSILTEENDVSTEIPFPYMNKNKVDAKTDQQDIVPQDLVDYFVSMAESEQCADVNAEIPYHCAFSFPAVAFTLGKENWPYLRKAYQSLAGAKPWKVRRTLASSIHEIAMILGEELTVTDLVPIYDGFIKDLDEVRIGVLKHLATFLKILKPTDRLHYLPRLNDFLVTDNEWNWRFRKELATQLLEAVTLFSATDVAHHIVSLSLQLLIDKVAAVRRVALTLVTRIVSHLSTDEALVPALIQELKDTLAVNTNKWIRRQTYALLCAQLISGGAISGDQFAKEMLPHLLNLSWDKVPNVRLAVARTLSHDVVPMGINWLGCENAENVERRLKQMRVDTDRDVRILAGGKEHLVLDVQREPARNIVF